MTLEEYLDQKIFANAKSNEIMADEEEIEGFEKFLSFYKNTFAVEKTAVDSIKLL